MKCPFCGSELEAGAGFCSACGTIISLDNEFVSPTHPSSVPPLTKPEPPEAPAPADPPLPERTETSVQPDTQAFEAPEVPAEPEMPQPAEMEPLHGMPQYVSPEFEAYEPAQTIRMEEAYNPETDDDDPFRELHPDLDDTPPVAAAPVVIPEESRISDTQPVALEDDIPVYEPTEEEEEADEEKADDLNDMYVTGGKGKKGKVTALIVALLLLGGAAFAWYYTKTQNPFFRPSTEPSVVDSTEPTTKPTTEVPTEDTTDKSETDESETDESTSENNSTDESTSDEVTTDESTSDEDATDATTTTAPDKETDLTDDENELTAPANTTATKESTTRSTASTTAKATTTAARHTTTAPRTTTRPATTRPTTTKPRTTARPTTTKPRTTAAPTTQSANTLQRPTKTFAAKTMYVNTNGVALRYGPRSSSGNRVSLSVGADVRVTAEENGYYYVYSNRYGVSGWVKKSLLGSSRPVARTQQTVAGVVAPDVSENGGTKTVSAGRTSLNLRKGPGTQYDVIRAIPNGYPVAVKGRSSTVSGWVYVTDITRGVSGWVSASYLR